MFVCGCVSKRVRGSRRVHVFGCVYACVGLCVFLCSGVYACVNRASSGSV